ncbi:endonuclease/exonuclease/phosphatase family protein [Massilia consociata]|uniref:Endonuclease/exonuclease/phosphatase family protein n=1 Tax=Massilia consociata TaxID=760117 RepID=A0ABV6FE75_9BURK
MFKLVTWNIQSGRSPDGKTDLDRIIACLDRLCSFDMLCVQEVSDGYTDQSENQFAMLRERLPGYTGIEAIACEAAGAGTGADGGQHALRRFGMMVFSRHPVLQALRHSLPWPPEPEVMSMPRMALELTVAAPGGLLRVTSVHLEYFSQRQRLAQVERLRELHREASHHARCPPAPGRGPFAVPPRAMPALLAGDFNMLPGSPEHQRLLAPFSDGTQPWRDCWQLAQPGRRHAPTVGLHDANPNAAAPFTFDYVFASADLAGRVRRVQVDASEQGSDHQALLVELDWGAA